MGTASSDRVAVAALGTAHGTIVVAGGAAGTMRHEDADPLSVDAVLLVALGERRGVLVIRSGATIRANRTTPPVAAVPVHRLALEDGNGVALRLDGGELLTAAPDGSMMSDRFTIGGWERFALLSAADGSAVRSRWSGLDALDLAEAEAVERFCRHGGAPSGLVAALLGLVPPDRREALVQDAAEADRPVLFAARRSLRLGPYGPFRNEWDMRSRLGPAIAAHGWTIGEHSYGAPEIVDGAHGSLSVGRYCSIAGGVRIVVANHLAGAITTYPFSSLAPWWPSAPEGVRDHDGDGVRIGHAVWIGAGATILPGARIGDGAIVGAGAVVRGDIPPFAVAVGNPARIARLRYDAPTIARLLAVGWWNWPDHRVDAAIGRLLDRDVAAFLDWAERRDGADLPPLAATEPPSAGGVTSVRVTRLAPSL